MALLGDRVAGPELLRLGLVAEVVANELVVSRCHEIASRIAGFPPGAGTNIKQSMIIQRQVADAEAFFQQAGGNTALLTAGMLKA
jgi:enoyl-CoA hydratase/carnithine racemase